MTRPEPGLAVEVADGLRRILAPNPGPMTHWGTNTFLVGTTEIAVVDPGPQSEAHLEAILTATKGQRVAHILVTHAHLDHSPLAHGLSEATGAPVTAFGPPEAGRRPIMQRLADEGLAGGGEGVDTRFAPDETVEDGDSIQGDGWSVEVLHTPGHFAGHIAFRGDDWILSGDHVMDWSSSLVSPPDGNLTDFMATCRRLQALSPSRLFPAHGGVIDRPQERLQWLIDHRLSREAALLDGLSDEPQQIGALTKRIYDIDHAMLPAAERNVFAHLIDLVQRNLVVAHPKLAWNAKFAAA
ncbi:MAG: MBL fold metallo-hydrolase [Paracoccaceae bacterium]|nr:MBL fold metallo-hydrolase [Paracoccaceae bacterium]